MGLKQRIIFVKTWELLKVSDTFIISPWWSSWASLSFLGSRTWISRWDWQKILLQYDGNQSLWQFYSLMKLFWIFCCIFHDLMSLMDLHSVCFPISGPISWFLEIPSLHCLLYEELIWISTQFSSWKESSVRWKFPSLCGTKGDDF